MMRATSLDIQEINSMHGEVCPRCKGIIRPVKLVSPGFGGSALMWKCENIACDQYNIKKTNTQITVGYIREVVRGL